MWDKFRAALEKFALTMCLIFSIVVTSLVVLATEARAGEMELPYITEHRLEFGARIVQEIGDSGHQSNFNEALELFRQFRADVNECPKRGVVCHDRAFVVFWEKVHPLAFASNVPDEGAPVGTGDTGCNIQPNRQLFVGCYMSAIRYADERFDELAMQLNSKQRSMNKVVALLDTPEVAEHLCYGNYLCVIDVYAKGTQRLQQFLK